MDNSDPEVQVVSNSQVNPNVYFSLITCTFLFLFFGFGS